MKDSTKSKDSFITQQLKVLLALVIICLAAVLIAIPAATFLAGMEQGVYYVSPALFASLFAGVVTLVGGLRALFVSLRQQPAQALVGEAAAGLALPEVVDGVAYTAAEGVPLKDVMSAAIFQSWLAKVKQDERFELRAVHFQSLDRFGPRVGFIKFKADIMGRGRKAVSADVELRDDSVSPSASEPRPLPGVVFMRGGSVGILPVFTCPGKGHFAVMAVQPRVPVGSFECLEIPAGMLDGDGNFMGVAAKELKEELGIEINEGDLTDMTALAGYPEGFFPTPGGSDETIRIFAFQRTISQEGLDAMNGKCTGVLDEHEQITLKVVPLCDLWRVGDGKTIVAYTLFKELYGQVPCLPMERFECVTLDATLRV